MRDVLSKASKPASIYRLLVLGLGSMGLCLAATVSAGTIYTFKNTDHRQDPPRVTLTTVKVQGPDLSIDLPAKDGESAGGQVIFRGATDELLFVNHREKTFRIFDPAMAETVRRPIQGREDHLAAARRNLEERLDGMTPEQRAALERSLGLKKEKGGAKGIFGQAPPSFEVRKTGEVIPLLDFRCEMLELFENGEQVGEVCSADWESVPGGDELQDVMHDMNNSLPGAGTRLRTLGGLFGDLDEDTRFPIMVKSIQDELVESESTLDQWTSQDLGPETFESPPGYSNDQDEPGQ